MLHSMTVGATPYRQSFEVAGKMTYSEQLQSIVGEYIADGQNWPATSTQIAAWAIPRGRWKPQRSSLIRQFAEQLSRAMREEYIRDPQGRVVRAKHAARVEQKSLWADIRTAGRKHMQIAFKQRRQQILGDCRQLKADVDSFNENRSPAAPIQLILDFTHDVAELEMLDKPLADPRPQPPRRPPPRPQPNPGSS